MHYRTLRNVSVLLAALLSHTMCAAVAYEYCALLWGGQYAAWSAPAWTAFLLVIPFGLGIAACLLLAYWCHRRLRHHPK